MFKFPLRPKSNLQKLKFEISRQLSPGEKIETAAWNWRNGRRSSLGNVCINYGLKVKGCGLDFCCKSTHSLCAYNVPDGQK